MAQDLQIFTQLPLQDVEETFEKKETLFKIQDGRQFLAKNEEKQAWRNATQETANNQNVFSLNFIGYSASSTYN